MARTRLRRKSFSFEADEIAERVKKFYDNDQMNRRDDIEARIQRYAKYRQWEDNDTSWDGASDTPLPDMMTDSLRMQDTLHNAVMLQRPTVVSQANHEEDRQKQEIIDDLLDFQFFEEQNGEEKIGELAETFINDGTFTAFIPWVKESRKTVDVKTFDPIPDEMEPVEYFQGILEQTFRDSPVRQSSDTGWDYTVEDFPVKFYTKDDGMVEMVVKKFVNVYDGPSIQVKDYEDVLYPPRSSNLQAPSPSNPGGAPHVILIDHPTLDEIARLQQSGFYDLLSKEDLKELEGVSPRKDNDEVKTQKDDFQGVVPDPKVEVPKHRTFTRLTCFDVYDIDGDGVGEDVIWWMLLETKTLLKAKAMTEMYPSNPPRRPFGEASFLPVKGRKAGISYLEMQESMHDLSKAIFDQSLDAGTLANSPFFFYRASSTMNEEVIRLWPGEGYPLGDPSRDVNFPNMQGQNQAFGFNMLGLVQQYSEKLNVIGDLQLGRVPEGKSSAFRTASGIQTLLSQGEARPERILRRFFMGLTQIWAQMHELNQHFLPKEKQYRITGFSKPEDDPYQTIEDKEAISGKFRFSFKASVMNTNKAFINESLDQMISLYLNPLAIQFGLIDADGAYRLLRDKGKIMGQDPDEYLTKPSPDADKPKILAEEALESIFLEQIPIGVPLEPTQEHLQKLQEFSDSDEFGLLSNNGIDIFKVYVQKLMERLELELRQQQLMEAAGQQQQGLQAQPTQLPDTSQPQVQNNEFVNENLVNEGQVA